jgi:hypothetical protein
LILRNRDIAGNLRGRKCSKSLLAMAIGVSGVAARHQQRLGGASRETREKMEITITGIDTGGSTESARPSPEHVVLAEDLSGCRCRAILLIKHDHLSGSAFSRKEAPNHVVPRSEEIWVSAKRKKALAIFLPWKSECGWE